MNRNSKKTIVSVIVFAALLALTLYVLFKGGNPGDLFKAMKNAHYGYLIAGFLFASMFIFCEGLNIHRGIQLLGYHKSIGETIRYAIVGFFFSSITPGASGGQPMQVYYMHKENIKISHSALALILEVLSFQIAETIGFVLGILLMHSYINSALGSFRLFIYLALAGKAIVISILLIVIFSKGMTYKLKTISMKIVRLFSKKNTEALEEKFDNEIVKYQSGASVIRRNKNSIIKMVGTSFVQEVCLYLVTFFVCRNFSLADYSWMEIAGLQAIVNVVASFVPLPGSIGANEGIFAVIFGGIIPAAMVSNTILVTRGLSLYLLMIICGIIIFVDVKRRRLI